MKAYLARLFTGRLNLATYIVGLIIFLLFVGLGFIGTLLLYDGFKPTPAATGFTNIYILISIIFLVSITRRRLHDVGLSGWLARTRFEVYLDGDKKENKYGKPPPPGIDFKGLFGF